jgi:hypothetical protein
VSDLPPSTNPPDVPLDDDAIEPATGLPTESKLFLGLGGFSLLLAVVYYVTTAASSEGAEWAGVAALLAGAAFSIFFGLFLRSSLRGIQADVEDAERAAEAGSTDVDEVLYLPETSIWPIGIGVGATLLAAGIPLGYWVMIPGAALFLHSLIGFARQSRDRT